MSEIPYNPIPATAEAAGDCPEVLSGLDPALLSTLTADEIAALEAIEMTMQEDRVSVDLNDSLGYGEIQEVNAAPVVMAAAEVQSAGSSDPDSMIRLLREETRPGSITPERLAAIFTAVKSSGGGGAGLTEDDRGAIISAQGNAETAKRTAAEAKSTAESALAKAEEALAGVGSGGKIDADTAQDIAQLKIDVAAAKTTADNAAASVTSVSNVAQSAKTTADSATTTANTAKTTADAALAKANANATAIQQIQGIKIWKGTLSAYEAMSSYDNDTLYFITMD